MQPLIELLQVHQAFAVPVPNSEGWKHLRLSCVRIHSLWDLCSLLRIALMSIGLSSNVRPGFNWPFLIFPACLMLLTRLLISSSFILATTLQDFGVS